MNFYEHTVIARQNLSPKDVDAIEKKYEDLILTQVRSVCVPGTLRTL